MNFSQAFNPWMQFANMGGLGGLGGFNQPMGTLNSETGLGAAQVSPEVQEMMQRWASMMSQGGQNVNPFQSFGQSGSPVFRPDGGLAGQGPSNTLARAVGPMGMMGRT